MLLKYIFVEMEKGWYSYRESLAYANFGIAILITAIYRKRGPLLVMEKSHISQILHNHLANTIFGLISSLLLFLAKIS